MRSRRRWGNNIKANFKFTGCVHSCVVLDGRIGPVEGVTPTSSFFL